jgi:hypothetical protein
MNASETTKHDPIFLRIALLLVRWDDRGKQISPSGMAAIPVPPVIRCLFLQEGTVQSIDFQQQ